MCDDRFKDFPRMGDGFVDRALADNGDLDELLFGIEKNDPKRFAIEKAHFRTEAGDRDQVIDGKGLAFLSRNDRAKTQRADEAKGFRAGDEGSKLFDGGTGQEVK